MRLAVANIFLRLLSCRTNQTYIKAQRIGQSCSKKAGEKMKISRRQTMNKQIKRFWVTLIIIWTVGCICTQLSFGIIWKNWRECINEPDCTSESVNLALRTNIIESAGYFLASHSDYQTFLNRVEMCEINGTDYKELRTILYSTIDHMEKARASYAVLKAASEKATYNQKIVQQLLIFDYDSFRVKYGLNEPIFNKVKSLLGKGDIVGLDVEMLANLESILSELCIAKIALEKDQLPEISILWRVNQAYSEVHLFGQYVSEVLKAILY
jgi:hypothetical protein